MSAATYNFNLDQGADFALELVMKEDGAVKDLTGYSARAQIRKTKEAATPAASFNCTIPTPTDGKIRLDMSNATSAAVAALGLITLPSAVAKPVAVAGYMVATATQNKYTYFRSAYDQGYGLQLIVRRNPSYNGYNAATLAEWVKTNSRMQ